MVIFFCRGALVLGIPDLQYAILERSLGLVGAHIVRQAETPAERTTGPFNPVVIFPVNLLLLLFLTGDGQGVLGNGNIEVLPGYAGQIGFYHHLPPFLSFS
jgi:hypothetical protein